MTYKFTIVRAALVTIFGATACSQGGVERNQARSKAAASEKSAASGLGLAPVVDARSVYTFQPVDPTTRFLAPLQVTASSAAALGLSNPKIIMAVDQAQTMDLVQYAGFGEAATFETLNVLATRVAARLGYASVCDFVKDAIAKSRVPQLALNPGQMTPDCLMNAIKQNPYLVYGNAQDGKLVVSPTCGGCHNGLNRKVIAGGATRLVQEPFAGHVVTRVNYGMSVEDLRTALDAELADGAPAGSSPNVRAAYTFAKEGTLRQDSEGCVRWNCSVAALSEAQKNGSPFHARNLGYLGAFSVFATAVNVGGVGNVSFLSDDELNRYSDTWGASAFWLGGARQGITDAVAQQPLMKVPERGLRNAMSTVNRSDTPTAGGFVVRDSSYSVDERFVLQYTKAGSALNPFGPSAQDTAYNQVMSQLLAVTYVRLPAIDNFITAPSLAVGGFRSLDELIAATPRYHVANLNEVGVNYFKKIWSVAQGSNGGLLPSEALCNWTSTKFARGMALYNQQCASSCHKLVIPDGSGGYTMSAHASAPVNVGGGAEYSMAIENAVIAANGTNQTPLMMARFGSETDPSLLSPDALQNSASDRTGPWGYQAPVAPGGYASMQAFIQAGGGVAPKGSYAVPADPSCGTSPYKPTAVSTDREALRGLYGVPEPLGMKSHPAISVGSLSSTDKTTLILFIEQVLRDRGANIDGLPTFIPGTAVVSESATMMQ